MASAPSLDGIGTSSKPTVNEAIEWLAEQRRRPDRQSAKVVEYGELIIEGSNIARKLGDEQWSFLEQVGLAALDVGNFDLAELCASRLHVRFPSSARAKVLQGMLLEARGEYDQAYQLYDSLLSKDETNLIIVKRLVAVLKCMDKKEGLSGIAAATQALVKYLDTYYADVEAWQELASLYLEQYMYAQAAFAMEELLLLEPHNTFFVLQYAECLTTTGDLHAAYEQYLRALEMCNGTQNSSAADKDTRQGPFVRTLWGLKLVVSKLLASPTSTGKQTKLSTIEKVPARLQEVDALVTDLLLNKAYAGSSLGVKATREAARAVLQQR